MQINFAGEDYYEHIVWHRAKSVAEMLHIRPVVAWPVMFSSSPKILVCLYLKISTGAAFPLVETVVYWQEHR
jgi:hypothetical protein